MDWKSLNDIVYTHFAQLATAEKNLSWKTNKSFKFPINFNTSSTASLKSVYKLCWTNSWETNLVTQTYTSAVFSGFK